MHDEKKLIYEDDLDEKTLTIDKTVDLSPSSPDKCLKNDLTLSDKGVNTIADSKPENLKANKTAEDLCLYFESAPSDDVRLFISLALQLLFGLEIEFKELFKGKSASNILFDRLYGTNYSSLTSEDDLRSLDRIKKYHYIQRAWSVLSVQMRLKKFDI